MQKINIEPRDMYNLSEASQYLRLGKEKIKKLVKRQLIPAFVEEGGPRTVYRFLGENLMRFAGGTPTIITKEMQPTENLNSQPQKG